MFPEERDLDQLESILKSISKLNDYKRRFGESQEAFRGNQDYQDLCFYALVQIGEAVHKLSQRFLEMHSEMDWESIYGMRCYLVHGYDSVSASIIWHALEKDIPSLEAFCRDCLHPSV